MNEASGTGLNTLPCLQLPLENKMPAANSVAASFGHLPQPGRT